MRFLTSAPAVLLVSLILCSFGGGRFVATATEVETSSEGGEAAGSVIAATPPSPESQQVGTGGSCVTDSDCKGKLNCISTNLLLGRRHCFPIECVQGAAHAMMESGFDPQQYLDSLEGSSNLRARDHFLDRIAGQSEGEGSGLGRRARSRKARIETFERSMKINPPPIETFMANYTACMVPTTTTTSDEEGEQDLDEDNDNSSRRRLMAEQQQQHVQRQRRKLQSMTYIGWGYQLACSCFGLEYNWKASWIRYYGRTIHVNANCGGGLLGVDNGLDVLLQIISDDESSASQPEDGGPLMPHFEEAEAEAEASTDSSASSGNSGSGNGGRVFDDQIGNEYIFGNTYYFPVCTFGPFGIQVGWFNKQGESGPSFIELSLGPSCGLSILGYKQCWNNGKLLDD